MLTDLTHIRQDDVHELFIKYADITNTLYYSYAALYRVLIAARSSMNPADRNMIASLHASKHPSDESLNMTDFIALGNTLSVYGLIG